MWIFFQGHWLFNWMRLVWQQFWNGRVSPLEFETGIAPVQTPCSANSPWETHWIFWDLPGAASGWYAHNCGHWMWAGRKHHMKHQETKSRFIHVEFNHLQSIFEMDYCHASCRVSVYISWLTMLASPETIKGIIHVSMASMQMLRYFIWSQYNEISTFMFWFTSADYYVIEVYLYFLSSFSACWFGCGNIFMSHGESTDVGSTGAAGTQLGGLCPRTCWVAGDVSVDSRVGVSCCSFHSMYPGFDYD